MIPGQDPNSNRYFDSIVCEQQDGRVLTVGFDTETQHVVSFFNRPDGTAGPIVSSPRVANGKRIGLIIGTEEHIVVLAVVSPNKVEYYNAANGKKITTSEFTPAYSYHITPEGFDSLSEDRNPCLKS